MATQVLGSAEEQFRLMQQAHRKLHDMLHTFNEIQCGPNPLTPAEVRALINKRPGVYGVLEKWATP